MKPGVFITFDVECSMGGAWKSEALKPIPPRRGMMGEYSGKRLGLPLICDILGRHNVRATFFMEPFNAELGYPGETEPVCRFLVEHGQNVQLHIHPNHVHYGLHREGKPYPWTDYMADLPEESQSEMVAEGADRIQKWTGVRPIAFRAGNMGASEETLPILWDNGLWIDSSYTFPYAGKQCRFPADSPYNGSKWYGKVLEVALSGFRQTKLPGLRPSQPVDLMGTSYEESRDAVRMICDAGADAVVILHSFSLFKVKDVQYNEGKLNWVVARRFERFCRWLDANRDEYPARTFAELGHLIQNEGYEPKSVEPCTIRRPIRAMARKVVQGLNSFYWF